LGPFDGIVKQSTKPTDFGEGVLIRDDAVNGRRRLRQGPCSLGNQVMIYERTWEQRRPSVAGAVLLDMMGG
jgi:hypothetical protein